MSDVNFFAMERRRHPRTPLQMSLPCIRLDPDGGDVVDRLRLFDVSRSGLGAYCDRPCYPGQRLVLSLPMTSCGGRRKVYATVRRCRRDAQGYQVGLEFDTASVGSCVGAGECVSAAA